MTDIEDRVSELFSQNLGINKEVITLKDVDQVIKIMGDPQEISGTSEKTRGQGRSSYRSRARRLYRDPDERILGGVSSGLGAYLGIDPVIVRILFVVFLFVGFGLLAYIILWILVPEAKTTAQKLEMRGDDVNVSNIGKFVKEEFESVKKNFSRNKK